MGNQNDNLPIRIDDETQEASDEYYRRKGLRTSHEIDAVIGLVRGLALGLIAWAAIGSGAWWFFR